jgi:hypothetical protein
MTRPWILGAMVAAGALSSNGANAFTISSPLSQGCHEMISSQALRAVRLDVPNAAPLALTANEQALVDDVQFVPDPDMKDLGGITLLVSVRDNDLKGRNSADLTQLAEVHGDPNNQEEHCLRSASETEPGGSEAAVADCRTFILGRISQALDGLDATGKPDSTQRTTFTLHLSLRGQMDASLPTYYVRMGQAIHAIQDSFTHTYRTLDGMKITVVLNWLALINGSLVESRDGPAHTANLDVCNDPDALRSTRHALAVEASAAVLQATLDPQATRAQKMTTVGAILDKYMSFSPGCTFDNQWCQAPESQYQVSATGCGAAGTGTIVGPILAILAVAAFARRRRWALLATLLIGGGAIAQSSAPPTAEVNEHAPPPPVTRPVAEPGPRDPSQTAWGAYAGLSGSVDNAALAGTVGARFRASKHWMLGLSGEWNPWVALNGTPIRAGVINVYASAILRYPLAYENFNLRTTGSLGGSYLLTTLYGAGAGSVGLFGELSPLGLEWKVSKVFFLILNPLNFALPVPQLRGVPLTYPQYRFSVGLEVSLTDLFSGRPQTRY